MTLGRRRFYHVIHLAQQVDEQNRLVVKILKPMYLLFIEVVHLVRCDYSILIEVNHLIPIFEGSQRRFVFFTKHEPDKVIVAHLALLSRFELARNLRKYSVDGFAGKSVALIPRKIFLVDEKIVVCVKLPKATVENIEVLIGEVRSDFVNVFL